MSPEPDAHVILARAAHARLLAGDDAIVVLLDAMREAVRQERAQQAKRAGWEGELTPTVTAQERLQPSQRPTAPPRPPPPLGSFGEQRRTPTARSMPPPAAPDVHVVPKRKR